MTDAAVSPPFAALPDDAGRRVAPVEVWTQVRDDYLAGLSAPACARRHGVGVSALRRRAAREGWRRADQPWIPPDPIDYGSEGMDLEIRVGGDLDKIGPRDLAYVADRQMMRAALRGDAAAAMRWRRLRIALEQDGAEIDHWLEREAFHDHVRGLRREAAPGSDVHSGHAGHGVFDDDSAPCAPEPRTGPEIR